MDLPDAITNSDRDVVDVESFLVSPVSTFANSYVCL
jgi:hypothetical protein